MFFIFINSLIFCSVFWQEWASIQKPRSKNKCQISLSHTNAVTQWRKRAASVSQWKCPLKSARTTSRLHVQEDVKGQNSSVFSKCHGVTRTWGSLPPASISTSGLWNGLSPHHADFSCRLPIITSRTDQRSPLPPHQSFYPDTRRQHTFVSPQH